MTTLRTLGACSCGASFTDNPLNHAKDVVLFHVLAGHDVRLEPMPDPDCFACAGTGQREVSIADHHQNCNDERDCAPLCPVERRELVLCECVA
jgi:hypothetical protein